MIPDILQNGDEYFFSVFTSAAEMGEYGDNFSKIEKWFLEAIEYSRLWKSRNGAMNLKTFKV